MMHEDLDTITEHLSRIAAGTELSVAPVVAPAFEYEWSDDGMTAHPVVAWLVTPHPSSWGVTLRPLRPGFTDLGDMRVPPVSIGAVSEASVRVGLVRVLGAERIRIWSDLARDYKTERGADGAWVCRLPEDSPQRETARALAVECDALGVLLAEVHAGADLAGLPISPELRLLLRPSGSQAEAVAGRSPRSAER